MVLYIVSEHVLLIFLNCDGYSMCFPVSTILGTITSAGDLFGDWCWKTFGLFVRIRRRSVGEGTIHIPELAYLGSCMAYPLPEHYDRHPRILSTCHAQRAFLGVFGFRGH